MGKKRKPKNSSKGTPMGGPAAKGKKSNEASGESGLVEPVGRRKGGPCPVPVSLLCLHP